MRFSRMSKTVGLPAVTALMLVTSCAGTGGTGGGDEGKRSTGGAVTVAETNRFTSFNSHSVTGEADINGKVSYLTKSGFYYLNDQLEVVRNEDFGTYKVTSEDPLTVEYTIKEGVAWSDGEPIDAGDLLLSWAVQSGHFDDENSDAETGTRYFAYSGNTDGLSLTKFPKISKDGRTMTLIYSEPYPDYEIAFNILDTPAHVVATGGGLADEEALVDVLRSAPAGDPDSPQSRPELQAVAEYWNTAFDTAALPSDPSLHLSSGPYVVHEMVANESMTLVRNDDYAWGPEPAMEKITIRYIGDPSAQVQALRAGEVDVVQPPASVETLASLQAVDGIQILTGHERSFTHIDLSYSGVFDDERVRKAFMHTIPRPSIVKSVIRPLLPEAEPRDSHVFDMNAEAYEAAVALNGSEEFEEPDIEKARELLSGATPDIRILYSVDNPLWANAYKQIAESAEKAGFKVTDGGLPGDKWAPALGGGTYDAAIFGWTTPSTVATGIQHVYGCDAASNFNGFCDEEAQAAIEELTGTIDPQKQQDLRLIVDTRLFETGYGLPLFQPVGIHAADEKIANVSFNSGPYGVWWNFWAWKIAD